jgi:hypothetical protein
MRATVFISLILSIFVFVTTANVYYGPSRQLLTAAPIFFGHQPFLTFGNITGILTTGNATNAKGNIVLCETFMSPVETMLLWCAQNNPAGIISVFPPTGADRVTHLGRTMYASTGMPYYDVPELLRRTHIVEIDQADYVILATEMATQTTTVTIDGTSPNEWLSINEGPFTVFNQITTCIAAAIVVIICIKQLHRWYKDGLLQRDIKTIVTIIAFLGNLVRMFYIAFSPTGLRRMLSGHDDFIFTTLVLTGVETTCTICALYWLETLIDDGLTIKKFLSNRYTIGGALALSGLWVIFLIILRILMEFPDVSPLASGLALFALILIELILIGISALVYTIISIILFVKIYKMENNSSVKTVYRSRRVYRAVYLLATCLSLWSLFATTVVAMTPAWLIPWCPQILQWWCYIAQPLIQGLQVVSFATKSSTNSTKTHSGSRTSVSSGNGIPSITYSGAATAREEKMKKAAIESSSSSSSASSVPDDSLDASV